MATTRIATPPRVSRSKKSAKSLHEVQLNDPMLAQARAVRDTLKQLESGHIPKGGAKLPLFNKDGTDFADPPAPVAAGLPRHSASATPSESAARPRRSNAALLPDLDRHRRKCLICKHPDREEIEEQFIHWRRPGDIAYEFDIEEERYLHRHAHAVGLYARRRENILFTLENLLERGDEIELTAAAYIKAVRAYACMCDTVRWTEPAIRVIGLRDHSAAAVHQSDDVEHSSLLPQAALGQSAAAAQSPTPLEEMNDDRGSSSSLPKAAFDQPAPAPSAPSSNRQTRMADEQSDVAPFASTLPKAAFDQPAPAPSAPSLCRQAPSAAAEQTVASPSSSLPQAASNNPARGTEPAPSNRLGKQDPVASSPSSLPEAAVDYEETSPVDALRRSGLQPRQNGRSSCVSSRERRTGPPGPRPGEPGGSGGRGSGSCASRPFHREASTPLRASSGNPRSAENPVSVASSFSSLPQAASELSAPSALKDSTSHVPFPTSDSQPQTSAVPNRPSPRLETQLSDRKQRKEENSNRP